MKHISPIRWRIICEDRKDTGDRFWYGEDSAGRRTMYHKSCEAAELAAELNFGDRYAEPWGV